MISVDLGALGFVGPKYQDGCITDVLSSVCDGLAVPGCFDILGLGPARHVAVIVVDGLGERQLAEHAELAPHLAGSFRRTLTSTVPSTTAAALTSIGTGISSGEHGLVGTAFELERGALLRPLSWRGDPDPHHVCGAATWWSRAARAGVQAACVSPRNYESAGLTRVALGGGTFVPADTVGERVAALRRHMVSADRTLTYGYWEGLDRVAHVHGVASTEYGHELRHVDLFVQQVAAAMPAAGRVIVTADHGMIDCHSQVRVDGRDFRQDVRVLAGEPRCRHVYVRSGAAVQVAARWRDLLAESALVLTRAEAVDSGLFGDVAPEHEARLGDLVVFARGDVRLTAPSVDSIVSGLLGQHGSLTPAEMLVPLVVLDA